MRSSSLVVSLLVLFLLVAAGATTTSLGDADDAAAAAAVSVHKQQGAKASDGGHGGGWAAAVDSDAFYRKVGRFAVWVYCMWNGINPVPKVESVLSAATRPAGGGGAMEYLLVLRVAGLGTFRALVRGVPAQGSLDWKLEDFQPVDGA